MTTDLDILRTAKLLIDPHGEVEAVRVSNEQAIGRYLAGDREGEAVWRRIGG